MDYNKPVIFEVGQGRIIIHPSAITPFKLDILAEKLGEVKRKHSIFGKYPMEEGETLEKWQERVLPLITSEQTMKEDEGTESYMTRIFKQEMSRKPLIKDTLEAIGEAFDQPGRVTDETYAQIPILLTQAKMIDFLKACDFNTSDYE